MANKDYTYNDFEKGIDKIYNNIMAVGNPFNRIIGLTRGGLIPAVVLSHKLEIPLTPLQWSNSEDGEKEFVEWITDDLNQGQKMLIVDDIVDSAKQYQAYWSHGAIFQKKMFLLLH